MVLFARGGPAFILVPPWLPGAVHIALLFILEISFVEIERIIVITIDIGSILLFRLGFNQKCFASHN